MIDVGNSSGVVLAAGRSTRMGRDKALLEHEGAPMWRRQRDVLASAGAREIFLSARPEQAWARAATGFTAHVHDDWPHAGPIAGITAALERSAHDHLLVLAIDLPRIGAGWLGALCALCGPGVGAVGRSGEFFEPLAAIYPRAMLPIFWEAVAGARYALQPVLARGVAEGRLCVREISAAEAAGFENWNEPKK